ncbi:ABC-type molybdenum transport system ATPase subunit/photorepair protein PhrA [Bifidobacterium commune]|nr:ABC-type molybdenum transport system ATPase subunit/photorepair protein PhrA [Bifidobacterium commune]
MVGINEAAAALRLSHVQFHRNCRVILQDVKLDIKCGENWVLFGPNGIGNRVLWP